MIKTLVVVVVLIGAVVAGLAYLPDETTKKIGSQAAGVFSKGCRGGRMLMDTFKETLKDKNEKKDEGSKPESDDPAEG